MIAPSRVASKLDPPLAFRAFDGRLSVDGFVGLAQFTQARGLFSRCAGGGVVVRRCLRRFCRLVLPAFELRFGFGLRLLVALVCHDCRSALKAKKEGRAAKRNATSNETGQLDFLGG
jgi:hypothetical protein